MAEVAGLAIRQKNLMLIESTLNASEWQIGSSWAALCENGDIVASSRLPNGACPDAALGSSKFFAFLKFKEEFIRAPLSGYADYDVRVGIPWLYGKAPFLLLILFSAALIIGLLLLIRRIEGSLHDEILKPLTEGMLSDSPLSIREFEVHRQAFAEAQRAKTSEAISQAVIQRGQQVAHDIRSPLTALDMILTTLSDLPEDKRIFLRRSVLRIGDIANDLKQPVMSGVIQASESRSVQLLSTLVDELITEKRLQYRTRLNIEIDSHLAFGAFANIQPREFKRVLSNLINNSVEAMTDRGRVEVLLSAFAGEAVIEIRDNGKGIPSDVLSRLGRRGETFDKEGGSGLGLYHARHTLESWGAKLDLISCGQDQGTTVTLRIPRATTPAWFVSGIELTPKQRIVIIDDDLSIHHVWDERFKASEFAALDLKLFHFSSPQEFAHWHKDEEGYGDCVLYLVDYEFVEQPENGLDCIERLGIGAKAVLVTSRFDEPGILTRAESLGVKLIPKGLSGVVPVVSALPLISDALASVFDAILIDDEDLIRGAWRFSAKKVGKKIKTFASLEQFETICAGLNRATPIFVDLKLGKGESGLTVSKDLHDRGFTELFICTGTDAQSVGEVPWVKEVREKRPPWQQRG